MEITRHQTAAAFLDSAQARLEQHEAANNLMISIAIRLKEYPDQVQHPPYLATVEQDDRLLAAAVMTPPHRVIIHGESADPAPLRLLAEDLRRFEWQPSGAIGPTEAAHAFAMVWIAMAGGTFRLLRHERVYELRRVIHPSGVPGRLRVATEADIALVAAWLQAFHQELGMEFNVDSPLEHARQRIDQRVIYLWEHGAPVSLAGRPRHTPHGMSIGPVYTPPEFRRHGYAGACVAALSQQLLDAGWEFCVLFTDLANPTSNSVYQKIGYRPVCDFDEWLFES
ncbi:MAG: GNAT family N-acetyltransferase [Anaerolineae bacterium]|jgi:hypothetical protein|nr:GNAT family N-acetyltransferase [Anaerolineae bacterium]